MRRVCLATRASSHHSRLLEMCICVTYFRHFYALAMVRTQQWPQRHYTCVIRSHSEAGQTRAENRRASWQNVSEGQTKLYIKGPLAWRCIDLIQLCIHSLTVYLLACALHTGCEQLLGQCRAGGRQRSARKRASRRVQDSGFGQCIR